MRFKERVGLLGNGDFVCCFCLVSKMLMLLKEVDALKKRSEKIERCDGEGQR